MAALLPLPTAANLSGVASDFMPSAVLHQLAASQFVFRFLAGRRWLMVAISAAVVAVTVASNWFACTLCLPTDSFGHEVEVDLETGALTVWWVPAPSYGTRDWVRFDVPLGLDWVWSFEMIDSLPDVWVFRMSSWLLSLPPAGLALLGFAFLRRIRVVGTCASCGYPRMHASCCPECGRVSPTHAATAANA